MVAMINVVVCLPEISTSSFTIPDNLLPGSTLRLWISPTTMQHPEKWEILSLLTTAPLHLHLAYKDKNTYFHSKTYPDLLVNI